MRSMLDCNYSRASVFWRLPVICDIIKYHRCIIYIWHSI
nr:MAG TPA: hypothetical protein [Caudoviricetes sp.]